MNEKNINIPAHGSNVSRSAIPAECKWHVEDIFPDEATWSAACGEFKAQLAALKEMQGTLDNAPALAQA